jgi:cbb3-type cytochrome oxidase subunit 3
MSHFLLENCGNISLVAFFIGFMTICWRVMRPSKKAEIESHALIPLKEEE